MKSFLMLILMSVSFNLLALPSDNPPNDISTFVWTLPITYTDGSALPVSEIAGSKLYWRLPSNTYTNIDSIDTKDNITTAITPALFPALADGNYIGGVTVYDINGIESVFSTEVSFIVVGGKFTMFRIISPPTQLMKQ